MNYYQLGATVDRQHVLRLTPYQRGLRVGGTLYHTVGDREAAVKLMGTGFAVLANELAGELGWTREHPQVDEADPRAKWYHGVAVPVLEEWQKFQAAQLGSYSTRWATSWDVYEGWQDRLAALRSAAGDNGFRLSSPAPGALPTTVWQDVADAPRSAARGLESLVWGILRLVVVGGALVAIGLFAWSHLGGRR